MNGVSATGFSACSGGGISEVELRLRPPLEGDSCGAAALASSPDRLLLRLALVSGWSASCCWSAAGAASVPDRLRLRLPLGGMLCWLLAQPLGVHCEL